MSKQSMLLRAQSTEHRAQSTEHRAQSTEHRRLTAPFLHTQVNTDIPSHSTMGRYCHAFCRMAFRVSRGGVSYEANTIPA